MSISTAAQYRPDEFLILINRNWANLTPSKRAEALQLARDCLTVHYQGRPPKNMVDFLNELETKNNATA